jgi:hypothetical protein
MDASRVSRETSGLAQRMTFTVETMPKSARKKPKRATKRKGPAPENKAHARAPENKAALA